MTSVPEEKEKGTKHECKTEQKKYFRFAPFPFPMSFPFANPPMMLSQIACGSMWVGLRRLETAESNAEREKQCLLMNLRWKRA